MNKNWFLFIYKQILVCIFFTSDIENKEYYYFFNERELKKKKKYEIKKKNYHNIFMIFLIAMDYFNKDIVVD